ncbi:class I SAM-dependent DNA methyltransferase, partial [Candidatus Gracilibacteria bacterium]|nr:class I SAM-dependent DNA methyltransferase [Candidatus Gracilibacteria bacterium]
LAKKYIRQFMSAKEFINNEKRWCLWLKNADPKELRAMSKIIERVQKVKTFREKSSKKQTRDFAKSPTVFTEDRQPNSKYILIPRHSSENRKYIPLGFFSKEIIIADSCIALPSATLFHFGVLTSEMHMAWTRYVCGRLEGRFRYSNQIVYNNFPWPDSPLATKIKKVEAAAQKVLDVRAKYQNLSQSPFAKGGSGASLADLYDPLTMPPDLVRAHAALDRAVDLCYRAASFVKETDRVGFLFERYEKLIQ